MSLIPSEIPDFGSAQLAPRPNPEFRPGVGFSTEDYFVLSRCDGHTSARQIIAMVGLATDRTIEILRKLRVNGAILLPGESVPKVGPPASAPARVTPATTPPAGERPADKPADAGFAETIELGVLSEEEATAMAAEVDLEDREKRRIIQAMRLVRNGDHYSLLGALSTTDKKQLKRHYFALSKEFHPDRHYKHQLGPFGEWLDSVFQAVSLAFEVLSDEQQRAAYDASLRGDDAPSSTPPTAQTRVQHAAELFDRACNAEAKGDSTQALTLFAAAIRVDAQARYLRRAALCALAAGELSQAEEYAKNGADLRADDPSYHRVLADVLRAAGRLSEAEQTLLRALELKTENDLLARELTSALTAVRQARGTST